MDSQCRIELLGGLCVKQADRLITRFRPQKAATLLSLLSHHLHRTNKREELIELLWPEVEPKAGHTRLNTELSSLRRHLEPAGVPKGTVFLKDHTVVQLNPENVVTDVDE